MCLRQLDRNMATISGEIISDFEFSHETFGEKFYNTRLMIKRSSGTVDNIPITVSERLLDVKSDLKGEYVRVEGQIRSHNKHVDNASHLILSVFAREFEVLEALPFSDDKNEVFLDAYICKEPTYRKTPLGREITDIMLAVNRPYGKSDYIPCIFWGRNARYVGNFEVGTHIQIDGRIQSREYQKKISDDKFETKAAYEVSARKIKVVEGTGNEE